MNAICSSVAPIREGSKTDWHRRRVLAHLVSLAISWALLTRVGSMVGFRGIPKRKHNTFHLESELELAGLFQSLDWVEGSLDYISRKIIENKPAGVNFRQDVIAVNFRVSKDFEAAGWVLPLDYYTGALEFLDSQKKSKILVTGDDDEYCKHISGILKNCGWQMESAKAWGSEKIVNDFWNMASAGKLILSNSTFAWWAAITGDYLASNNLHQVVIPDPWLPSIRTNLRRNSWIPFSHQTRDFPFTKIPEKKSSSLRSGTSGE
jgi:hypothetical protein